MIPSFCGEVKSPVRDVSTQKFGVVTRRRAMNERLPHGFSNFSRLARYRQLYRSRGHSATGSRSGLFAGCGQMVAGGSSCSRLDEPPLGHKQRDPTLEAPPGRARFHHRQNLRQGCTVREINERTLNGFDSMGWNGSRHRRSFLRRYSPMQWRDEIDCATKDWQCFFDKDRFRGRLDDRSGSIRNCATTAKKVADGVTGFILSSTARHLGGRFYVSREFH